MYMIPIKFSVETTKKRSIKVHNVNRDSTHSTMSRMLDSSVWACYKVVRFLIKLQRAPFIAFRRCTIPAMLFTPCVTSYKQVETRLETCLWIYVMFLPMFSQLNENVLPQYVLYILCLVRRSCGEAFGKVGSSWAIRTYCGQEGNKRTQPSMFLSTT